MTSSPGGSAEMLQRKWHQSHVLKEETKFAVVQYIDRQAETNILSLGSFAPPNTAMGFFVAPAQAQSLLASLFLRQGEEWEHGKGMKLQGDNIT